MPPPLNPKEFPVNTLYKSKPFYYVVQKDEENNKVWKKLSGKFYQIHWNGGRPFVVRINDVIEIYKTLTSDTWKLHKTISSYEEVFIGKSPKNEMTEFSGGYGKKFEGNTILIKLTKKSYLYISDVLYKFKTSEEITDFIAPVGNSDVPYPYAISKNYIYLPLEKVYFNKKNVESIEVKKDDPYSLYYTYKKSQRTSEIEKEGIYKNMK